MKVSNTITYIEKLERIKILKQLIKDFNRTNEMIVFGKHRNALWKWNSPMCGLEALNTQLKELLK